MLAPPPEPARTPADLDGRAPWTPCRVATTVGVTTLAAIHLALLPAHAAASAYLGVLFAVIAVCGFALAARLLRRPTEAALAGVVTLATTVTAGYLASRTTGLPGYLRDWDRPGITTLAIAVLTILAAGVCWERFSRGEVDL